MSNPADASYIILRITHARDAATPPDRPWMLAIRADGPLQVVNERAAHFIKLYCLVTQLVHIHNPARVVDFLLSRPATALSTIRMSGEQVEGWLKGLFLSGRTEDLRCLCIRRTQVHLPEEDIAGCERFIPRFLKGINHPATIDEPAAFAQLVYTLAHRMKRLSPTSLVGMKYEENVDGMDGSMLSLPSLMLSRAQIYVSVGGGPRPPSSPPRTPPTKRPRAFPPPLPRKRTRSRVALIITRPQDTPSPPASEPAST